MTKTFLFLSLVWSGVCSAHEGGHGPKVSDTGKYGGLISAVVAKADAEKGAAATLVHKAELSRSADTIRIYLYDKDMKPLDLKAFDKKGSASLIAKVKGKAKEMTFPLDLKGGSFQGPLPKAPAKPYSIDVHIKEKGQELTAVFENLD